MLDVLLPSAYFCDLIFTGLAEIPKPGEEVFSKEFKVIPGAGFIPAVALTRLGLQVGWACDFGNDFLSRYVLEEADHQNLNASLFRMHDRPLQAISVAYSFSGDRAFLSYIDALPPTDLIDLIKKNPARWLMFMSLRSDVEFLETVEAAHRQDTLVFMDGQVLHGADLKDPLVLRTLKSLDVFAVNEMEALQITEKTSAASALDVLSTLTSTVVIKLGVNGAIARSRGERVYVPGIPAGVLDTTGAGDNFDCGFLYGFLHNYSLKDCLLCGNYCGSQSVTAYGGWSASPIADQLEAYLGQTHNIA